MLSNQDLIYTREMYYLYDRVQLFVVDLSYSRFRDMVEKIIKSGIPPLENSFNSYVEEKYVLYKKYWDPIKLEHQKKADAMK